VYSLCLRQVTGRGTGSTGAASPAACLREFAGCIAGEMEEEVVVVEKEE
jgi:hypothetical protein